MGAFFGFILLFVLLLVLVPVLWVVSSVFKMRRRFKRAVNDAAPGGQRGQTSREPQTEGSRKVYAKDVGEYVNYEEIIVDRGQEEKPPHRKNVRPEPRISDVEFEEITQK